MQNMGLFLRKQKVRYPDGSVSHLGEYLKSISNSEIKKDIEAMVDVTMKRLNITNDRRVLTELYAMFVSLNVDKDTILDVATNQEPEESQ